MNGKMGAWPQKFFCLEVNGMNNPAPRDVFETLCRIIAEIDHEIVFNELDGVKVDGQRIRIKPREEDVEYRYGLFLEMYHGYSEGALKNEIRKLKVRLKKSLKFKKSRIEKIFKADKLEMDKSFVFIDDEFKK